MTATKASIAAGALTEALIEMAAQGQRPRCSQPRCSQPEDHYLWLSEDHDERRQAARLCAGCPVIDPCDRAASAQRASFGTWAGRDRTRPRKS